MLEEYFFQTEDSMIRPLEDQGIQKLYPIEYGTIKQHALGAVYTKYLSLIFLDKKSELKKLNRSILICFLELLDMLITNPSSPEVHRTYNKASNGLKYVTTIGLI